MTAAIQFAGVASGIDTKAIIDAIIAADGRHLKQLQKHLLEVQKRQTALNEVKSKLVIAQQKVTDLSFQSKVNGKAATPTDLKILTATANAEAATGVLNVNVKQLATGTVVTSTAAIGADIDETAALSNVGGSSSPAGLATVPSNGTFTINGKTVTIGDVTIATLDDVRDAINDATGAAHGTVSGQVGGFGVTASIVTVNGRKVLQLAADNGNSLQLGATGDTSNFLTAAKLLASSVSTTKSGGTLNLGSTSGGATLSTIDVAGANRSDTYTFSFDGTNQLTLSRAGKSQTVTISALGAGQSSTLNFDQLGIKVTVNGGAAGAATSDVGNLFDNSGGGGSQKTIITTETVRSQSNLGTVLPGQVLSSARVDTAGGAINDGGAGTGAFTINGATINWALTDSLNTIISRINGSAANVVAAYDVMRDGLTLTSKTTGSSLISLGDTTGNFLAKMNVTTFAAQTAGQNAVVTINGGPDFASASNTVSDAISGVFLKLKTTGTTQVSVIQDADTTVTSLQSFVTAFNDAFSLIREDTKYDPITKTAAILFGDVTAGIVKSNLQTILTSSFIGATSGDKYQSLMDIGVSFGAVGSAVGTTTSLVLNETKLRNAITTDANAVEKVIKAFTNSVTLTTAGDIAAASGSPAGTGHKGGDFQITSDGAGNLTATFTPTGGTSQTPTSGTIVAGGTNTSLIPGVTLTAAGAFTSATSILSVPLILGVAHSVNDYLKNILGVSGLFKARDDAANNEVVSLNKDISDFQRHLDAERLALQQKFTAMESALGILQQQGQALSAQLSALNNSARR